MEHRNASAQYQASMANKIQSLLRLCRVCLGKTGNNFILMRSTYFWSETEAETTEKMIEMLLNLKLDCQGERPQRICSKCINRVRLIFAFRNQCEETNKKLLKFQSQIINRSNIDGSAQSCVKLEAKIPAVENASTSKTDQCVSLLRTISATKSEMDRHHELSTDHSTVKKFDKNADWKSNNNMQLTCANEANHSGFNGQNGQNTNVISLTESDCSSQFSDNFDSHEDGPEKPSITNSNDECNETISDLCAHCGISFENSVDYSRHMRSKHEEGMNRLLHFLQFALNLNYFRLYSGIEKKFACQFCEKRFKTRAGRDLHHNLHTQEEQFICDLCGKVFLTRISIILHFKYHLGIKKHTCNECGYRFVTLRELKVHIKCKHSIKSIVCTYSNCTKTFSSEHFLNIHLRVHDTNHAFVCNICGVATVNKFRLIEHKRIHTGADKRQCPVCFKVLARKRNVTRHIKTRHKDFKMF